MAIIGEGISHRGFVHEDFNIPFNITGSVDKDNIGDPVTIDTANARAVKIAGDGDPIIGVLMSYEDRTVEGVKVGTVAMKGGFRMTAESGHGVTVGDTVVGSATAGQVKARRNAGDTANEADYSMNIVTHVDGDTIEVLIS